MNWFVLIAALVIIALVFWGITTYNSFIRLRNNCEEGYSTMDVYMKKRFDLIPNLVATVKGYAAHESGTLEKVIAARNAAAAATTVEQRVAGENQISGALRQLFALSESYPDLKANTNFIDLQNQLKSVELDIANARKYYNAVVKTLNTKVEQFPSNLIAGIFHFERMSMFVVEDAAERNAVKVEF